MYHFFSPKMIFLQASGSSKHLEYAVILKNVLWDHILGIHISCIILFWTFSHLYTTIFFPESLMRGSSKYFLMDGIPKQKRYKTTHMYMLSNQALALIKLNDLSRVKKKTRKSLFLIVGMAISVAEAMLLVDPNLVLIIWLLPEFHMKGPAEDKLMP